VSELPGTERALLATVHAVHEMRTLRGALAGGGVDPRVSG
jgi:hypothetical protein